MSSSTVGLRKACRAFASRRPECRKRNDEFADLTKPRHFEHSDPDCDCENVSRFSVSLKKSLFRQLDDMIKEKGYENRSLAIAGMIRDGLVEHWQESGEFDAIGTILIAYNPRDARVRTTLSKLQEHYLNNIVVDVARASDVESCLDILVVRGKASAIKAIADRLIAAKGVKHGKLSLSAVPSDLAGSRGSWQSVIDHDAFLLRSCRRASQCKSVLNISSRSFLQSRSAFHCSATLVPARSQNSVAAAAP